MNISALCKTFRGDEFIEAMVRSIYNYVDKIVFVNSEQAWISWMKGNTCKKEIQRVKELMDRDDKIVSLDFDTSNQFIQCMYGFNYIKRNFKCDFVMLIDTDEVWDEENLQQAIKYLNEKADHSKVYCARLYTYIKKVMYRVHPIERMAPTVFVSTTREDLGTNYRSCRLPAYQMCHNNHKPVMFHHFVYVRRNLDDVLQKIITSNMCEGNSVVNLQNWTNQIWNRLPRINGRWREGIHPAVGFEHHWKGIKEMSALELPEVFQNYPHLIEQFEKAEKEINACNG